METKEEKKTGQVARRGCLGSCEPAVFTETIEASRKGGMLVLNKKQHDVIEVPKLPRGL